jgi:hypothetical protein
MSEQNEIGTPPTVETGDRYGGALGRIRAQRKAIAGKEHLVLRVPDYDDLQIRYRLMSERATEEIQKKIEAAQRSGTAKKNIDAVADFIIAACDAIMVRVGDGFEVLVDENDQKVRFDNRLAEVLGIGEVDEARKIVLETFSPEGEDGLRRNPDAMIDQVEAVIAWRKGREYEIDSALLGE